MASHTFTDTKTAKKHKLTKLTYRDIKDRVTIIEQGNSLKNAKKVSDLAHEDLETLITHHNIVGNIQNLPHRGSYRKMERIAQALGVKATTIDLVGGIFCHRCKLTYSNKKEFDVHYAKHESGEKFVYTCVVCFREFNSYPSFRGHCYTSHVIKDRHKCEFCSKYFSKLASLRDHVKVMHVFKCPTCSKKFSSKNELVLHQAIHNTSNAPPYHCQICEVEIANLDSCKDHADIHTVNIYSCPICNENISSRENAADHLIQHFDNVYDKSIANIQNSDKGKDEPSIAVIQNSDNLETSIEYLGGIACGYCSVVSKNRVEFDAHFSHEHGDKDIEYICVVCDKSFEKYSMFGEHAYNHRSKDRFCCSICLKTFPRLSLLTTHIAACKADAEASGKPFACSECGHRYVTEQSLRRHLLDAHGLHSVTCPVEHCRKTFATPKELLFHQQVHSSHGNWCRQCGLAFPSLGACAQHLDVHKRKLFGCPVCNKTYRERHVLLNHLAQHFTSVLHICKVCGKVYNNRRNFMDHLKTHSEKKNHSCSYCGKGFVKLDQLQQHLNIHTGSKPYKCTICSRTFAAYPNFAKHKRRMHNLEGKINNPKPTSDKDEIDNSESVGVEDDANYTNSHTSKQDEGVAEINPQIKDAYYVYAQDSGMNPQIINNIEQVQDSAKKPQTIDHIDEEDSTMEAESIIHIDIEKELQILENIPESQNNDNIDVDVLATDETIFNNAGTEAPPSTVPLEANNFPPEYGPEFTLGDSYGFLDLDGHMLPHIDPLLTIKTEEFNHNLPLPDFDAGTYQVTPKWEPPIFTKVCPEYPYGYGDMVDSNRLSMMNTDIF